MLHGKRILLIISGGIAAYKSLDLIRRLRERGAEVRGVLERLLQRVEKQVEKDEKDERKRREREQKEAAKRAKEQRAAAKRAKSSKNSRAGERGEGGERRRDVPRGGRARGNDYVVGKR